MMYKILDINERILYIIDNQYNGSQKKFAERIGFAAQVVFNIVSGRKSKPSYDVLYAILSTNDYINAEWLIMGHGEMLKQKEAPSTNEKDTYIIELQKDKIRSLEKELQDQKQTIEQLKKELLLASSSKVGVKSDG
ncbi:helix-turn-helix domain-containing protein [Flavobacterium urocaniciphilum]|uniref:Helix-turn-helix n=1 Tax=Flavobacterium urocaniciphilum TaxID=1299341 RepID=A0A1H9BRD0_9FLAO|nr:helix-turn-helix domain-containing protein [Flavobacterium urocaniciphilum]SEP91445.1 Helix-turn-helix [Flavobacterium urocaniciphilum]